MAAERLPMRKLREIIRLKLQAGQSNRAIARACGLSNTQLGLYSLTVLTEFESQKASDAPP